MMTNNTEYNTKTIEFDVSDSPSAYRLMITLLDPIGNEVLERTGFGSGHMIYTAIEGRPMRSHYDPLDIARHFNEDDLKDFLMAIDKNSISPKEDAITWEELEDGETYTTEDI